MWKHTIFTIGVAIQIDTLEPAPHPKSILSHHLENSGITSSIGRFVLTSLSPLHRIFASIPVLVDLLPHSDAFDNHLPVPLPSGIPLVSRIPEVLLCCQRLVNPRLSAPAVLEPPVSTSNTYIQDEEEFLIKGGIDATVRPRISDCGTIAVRQREVAPLPERYGKWCVENLKQTSIYVSKQVFFTPLETKSVLFVGECSMKCVTLNVRLPPIVVRRVWTPVKGTGDYVVTSLSIGVIVPTRLHHINLARFWPGAIIAFNWQEPNGWPQPVALWKGRSYFDSTVPY